MITVELVNQYREKFRVMNSMEELKEIREGFRDANGLTDVQALGLLREKDATRLLGMIEEINQQIGGEVA